MIEIKNLTRKFPMVNGHLTVLDNLSASFDEKALTSYSIRNKEEAQDYKYFPEPDLPPVLLSEEYINGIKSNLPELPDEKKKRWVSMGITAYDAELICTDMKLVMLFEETVKLTKLPKITANWITGEVMALNGEYTVESELLAAIINCVKDGRITREAAKETFFACVKNGINPRDYIKENSLEIISDSGLINAVAEKTVKENAKAVEELKQGKSKALNFLVGQCMRELKGKAAPDEVRAAINRIIE